MEVPKFVKCPECDEKYNDKKKRRIIDSCGHPRCFSCLVLDNQCIVCEKILSRRKSWISSRESLSTTDDKNSNRGSTYELFSKERYLRMLYSYDPESPEHTNTRRGSFDLHTCKRLHDRQIKLGQHSNSALALTNVISNSSPTLKKITDARRNFPDISLRKTAVASSSLEKIKNENQQRQPGDGNSDTSQITSPRSSGYWSEIESCSDQEEDVSGSGKSTYSTNTRT